MNLILEQKELEVKEEGEQLVKKWVFGLLKRGDKVFTKIVPNCSKEVLMPIIQGLILDGSSINTDGWKAYDGLILKAFAHHRVYHSQNEASTW